MAPHRGRHRHRGHHRPRPAGVDRHCVRGAPGRRPQGQSRRSLRRGRIGQDRQRHLFARLRRSPRDQRRSGQEARPGEQRPLRRRLVLQAQALRPHRSRRPALPSRLLETDRAVAECAENSARTATLVAQSCTLPYRRSLRTCDCRSSKWIVSFQHLMPSAIQPVPASSRSLEIALSPAGHLLAELSDDAQPKLEAAAVSRLTAAFTASSAHGLELLAADFLHAPLPASLGFWRDLVRRFFTGLCHSPDQEHPTKLSVPAPTEAEFTALAETAPPMRGLEYLDAATLARLWGQLEARVRDQIQRTEGGVAAYLRAQNPVWNAVGRVTFHLAENKRSPEQPFAFLATYTHRVSDAGQAQHIPLGRALQEYAGAQNRAALTTLLSPVQRAAEKSKLARELLDSRAIFHPQAWPPAQAYRFLKEIPLLEQSGIIVRIPDWWKA